MGKYNGDEVVQEQVKFPDQGIKTPAETKLKGFKRSASRKELHFNQSDSQKFRKKNYVRVMTRRNKFTHLGNIPFHGSANLLDNICLKQRNYNSFHKKQADTVTSHSIL